MSRQRRKKEKNGEEGAPQWMVTYSDMVTLLLAFFVLLFSFSTIEKKKFQEAMESIRSAFGLINRSSVMVAPTVDRILPIQRKFEKTLEEVISEIREIPEINEEISYTETEEGVRIRISNPVLFDTGRDEIKQDIYSSLQKIGDVLKTSAHDIIIEGHTDDIPIHNEEFNSNWELSAARAVSVVEYFIQNGLSPWRFRAVGYGEYQPLAENNTEEGRRKNRRVEILIPNDNWPAESE